MTDQRPLLPCPFCGSDNVKTFGPYGWYRQWGISHSCRSFYSGTSEMMQSFPTEADAIAAWNTRLTTEQDGWVRVPFVPTERMLFEAFKLIGRNQGPASVHDIRRAWNCMIAAAPPANILDSTKEAGL